VAGSGAILASDHGEDVVQSQSSLRYFNLELFAMITTCAALNISTCPQHDSSETKLMEFAKERLCARALGLNLNL
jgi:hypothetical protein